ncbi:MAG TPA: hypothetical protein VG917_01625 [Patescibacteria group bacterium]|nr:hypothetical protein [Patescibacteria group bacterium]
MSVEHIFKQDFAEFDAENKRRVGLSMVDRENVASVAGRRLIDIGGEYVKDISRHLDPSVSSMEPEDVRSAMIYGAAPGVAIIAYGAAIIYLENALVDKYFDFENYITEVNLGLKRTLHPGLETEGITPVEFLNVLGKPLDDDGIEKNSTENNGNDAPTKWKRMIDLQAGDRYFTKFFLPENEELLPNSLKDLLNGTGLMDIIRLNLITESQDGNPQANS